MRRQLMSFIHSTPQPRAQPCSHTANAQTTSANTTTNHHSRNANSTHTCPFQAAVYTNNQSAIRPNFLLTQLYLSDLLQLQTNTASNAKQPSKPGHHTPRHNMASTSMHRAITTQRLHSCDASSVIHTQPTRSRYHTLNIISIS